VALDTQFVASQEDLGRSMALEHAGLFESIAIVSSPSQGVKAALPNLRQHQTRMDAIEKKRWLDL